MKNLKTHIYRPFAISLVLGVFSVFAVLSLGAAIIYALQLPVEVSGLFGVISLAAGCFAAGLLLGKMKRRQGLKQGFLCGTALFLLCFIASLVVGEISAGGFFGRLAICVGTGALGGVLGVNTSKD